MLTSVDGYGQRLGECQVQVKKGCKYQQNLRNIVTIAESVEKSDTLSCYRYIRAGFLIFVELARRTDDVAGELLCSEMIIN